MATKDPAHRLDRVLHDVREIADPMERLTLVRAALAELGELETRTVLDAREAGATWRAIGALYGLSKQGAQQRFQPERRSSVASSQAD